MTILVEYQGKKYFISDKKTLEKYNYLFSGFLYLKNSRYKKYITADKNILVEV